MDSGMIKLVIKLMETTNCYSWMRIITVVFSGCNKECKLFSIRLILNVSSIMCM